MSSAGFSDTCPRNRPQATFGRKPAFDLSIPEMKTRSCIATPNSRSPIASVAISSTHVMPAPNARQYLPITRKRQPGLRTSAFRTARLHAGPHGTSSATLATAMSHHQSPHSRASARWLLERAFSQPCCAPAFPSNTNRDFKHCNYRTIQSRECFLPAMKRA